MCVWSLLSANTAREVKHIEAIWVQNSDSFPSFPCSISERNWKNGSVSTKQNCSLQACIWQAVSLLTSFGYSLFGEAWQENRRTVQTPKQSGTKFSGSQSTHTQKLKTVQNKPKLGAENIRMCAVSRLRSQQTKNTAKNWWNALDWARTWTDA